MGPAAERPEDLPKWFAEQALDLFCTSARSPTAFATWMHTQFKQKVPLPQEDHSAHQIVAKENEQLRDKIVALKRAHAQDMMLITREPSSFSVDIFELLRRVQTKQQAALTTDDVAQVSAWLDEDSSDIDSWLPKNPELKDYYTPICMAARLGETELVRLLLDR